MSEIQICKNCGKPIREFQDIHRWYHIDTGVASCYPDKVAVPEEKCQSYIIINEVKHYCELEYGHEGYHYILFDRLTIKW